MGFGESFPTFAKGVVGVGYDYEGGGIGFFDFEFDAVYFFVAHNDEEHFLIRAAVKALAFDDGGGAFEVVKDEVAELLNGAFADDEEDFVVLAPVDDVVEHLGGDEDGDERVEGQQE